MNNNNNDNRSDNFKSLTDTRNTDDHDSTDEESPFFSQLKNSGILWDIMRLIIDNSPYPQGIFAVGGSIALTSLLIGNKYMTTDGMYGNLYIISIGPSGCGKDAPRSTIKATAKTFDLAESVPDSLASAAGLEDYLASLPYPEALLLIDEFGKFLQQKSIEDFGITGVLLKLYTSVNSTYIKRLKANQCPSLIENPFVSLYGTTTEEAIHSALSESDSECGWIGRFLFLNTNIRRPVFQNKQHIPTPFSVIAWYMQLLMNSGDKVVVTYSELAEQEISIYQTKIDDYLRSDTINPIARSASVRLVEMMKKLSLIRAVSQDPIDPIIDVDDVSWAIAIVEHSKDYVQNVLSPVIENSGVSSLESRQLTKCLKLITRVRTFNDSAFLKATEKGFMPKRMLLKKMNTRSNSLNVIISTLQDRGDIGVTKLTAREHGINCDKAYYVSHEAS